MDESPTAESFQPTFKDTGIDESCIKTLKDIGNDVEQIGEIRQSLNVISREIISEVTKVLQLNNRPLQLGNFTEGEEVDIHPNGFVLIRDEEGDIQIRLLTDLEPSLLHAILKRLIPKLKASLDERKQAGEDLLEDLIKVRDTLI